MRRNVDFFKTELEGVYCIVELSGRFLASIPAFKYFKISAYVNHFEHKNTGIIFIKCVKKYLNTVEKLTWYHRTLDRFSICKRNCDLYSMMSPDDRFLVDVMLTNCCRWLCVSALSSFWVLQRFDYLICM